MGGVPHWAGDPTSRTYKRNKTEGLGMRAISKSGMLPYKSDNSIEMRL